MIDSTAAQLQSCSGKAITERKKNNQHPQTQKIMLLPVALRRKPSSQVLWKL